MARIKRYGSSPERFDNWSHTYEKPFTWRHFFNPVHEFLVSEIGDVKGARVIDIGCGTGATTVHRFPPALLLKAHKL